MPHTSELISAVRQFMSSAKASTPAAANSSEPLPTATAGGVPPSYYSRCGGSTAVVHKDYTGVPTDAAIRACKHGVAIHWYPSSRRVPNRGNMPALLHSWASLVGMTECASRPLQTRRFPPVARVPWPDSAAAFRRFALRGLPVVFTGAWAGSRLWRWSFARLRDELGGVGIRVRHGDYSSKTAWTQVQSAVGLT